MKLRKRLTLLLLVLPLVAAGQNPNGLTGTTPTSQGAKVPGSNAPGTTMAASGAIKVLSPKINEKVESSAVTLRFQLQNTGMAPDPSPTYRVQLDSRDPVEITSTEYSFSGIPVGDHVITVELVDANHTPVAASQTQVRFTTVAPGSSAKQTSSAETESQDVTPKSQAADSNGSKNLPSAGSELPLLSMVGFGVLVGGVISAMRTRR
ncbi:MAG TPA: hypothetical protein VN577_03910 [Terriglobales bacterium]|nr:hypothetical protein [Terriglobales bacterium]